MIGKGGFGVVYKCLDVATGECVAIKSITSKNISKAKLKDLQAEINLLKQLSASSEEGVQYITHYINSFYAFNCLHIILEIDLKLRLCEQGSLLSILKKYGVFPENLIAVYMRQVLLGVSFLHRQGIIHRDIKGANILTTRKGEVKLADFGVSVFLEEGAISSVAGTAYWMAPEIIELRGACEESDIWSLGCTVIELLTGYPPYFHMAPMPAMYAIVQNDLPPFPEGLSDALQDFLNKTFQKYIPNRGKAEDLLKHPFIKQALNKKVNIWSF
ncbi:hypothetical protein Zmor_004504 [Zophobas morio]|uniref:non-specific serine/threonine protein kinase n=1 Tax=Zophobas morio TaxID=2755281 RepID=A0AA38M073_9CUCU|nr:hypothetical protein Zmor_004504 [Zophobas morio]